MFVAKNLKVQVKITLPPTERIRSSGIRNFQTSDLSSTHRSWTRWNFSFKFLKVIEVFLQSTWPKRNATSEPSCAEQWEVINVEFDTHRLLDHLKSKVCRVNFKMLFDVTFFIQKDLEPSTVHIHGKESSTNLTFTGLPVLW